MEAKVGSFVYRDAFLAEVAEGKRHARASDPELRDLLVPKKGSVPPKDQVAHWYEAQLLHYGLPRTKDKNTAKVRLMGALTSGKLSVPSDVQKVEADLKKEYVNNQRKAKAAAKKEQTQVVDVPAAGKKRKAGDLENTFSSKSATTKILVKVGDMTFEIDQQTVSTAQTTAKKQKASASPAKTPAKKSTTKAAEAKPTNSTNLPKSRASVTKPTTKSKAPIKPDTKHKVATPVKSSTGQSGVGHHPRTKQTARRSGHVGYANRTGGRPVAAPEPVSMSSNTYYDDDESEPPPPYTEYDEEKEEEEEEENDNQPRGVQIFGYYSINNISSGEQGDLSLRLSNERGQLWGNFTLGEKIGVVRLDNIDGIGQGVRKSFGWRSEDVQTGGLRFGKGCDGWVEFDGAGSVRGAFYGLMARRDVNFEGQLEEDFNYESDYEWDGAIGELSARWHDFPDRGYNRK